MRQVETSNKKKETKTYFRYNKLWKLLIDRGMKKQELQQLSEVSPASIAKMGRCENVTTDVLLRICEALDCQIEDIMERVEREPIVAQSNINGDATVEVDTDGR